MKLITINSQNVVIFVESFLFVLPNLVLEQPEFAPCYRYRQIYNNLLIDFKTL